MDIVPKYVQTVISVCWKSVSVQYNLIAEFPKESKLNSNKLYLYRSSREIQVRRKRKCKTESPNAAKEVLEKAFSDELLNKNIFSYPRTNLLIYITLQGQPWRGGSFLKIRPPPSPTQPVPSSATINFRLVFSSTMASLLLLTDEEHSRMTILIFAVALFKTEITYQ